jgi:putative flippase GtrA
MKTHKLTDQDKPTTNKLNQEKPRVLIRGFRYLIVGGTSALIELALFSLIYYLSKGLTIPANIIAVCVATSFNFLVNRNFTFKSTSNFWRSAILYLLLFGLNLAFTTVFTTILINYGAFPLLAKLTTMACVTMWNFFLYNKVVFR